MKHKLPEPFRTKWIEALESGKYRQTKGKMYDPDNDAYCCLGVASKLCGTLVITGGFPDEAGCPAVEELYGGNEDILEEKDESIYGWLPSNLAWLNDDGYTFKEIAIWLKENTEGYKQ